MIPAPIYTKGVRHHMNQKGAFVFYIHPWELDPGQPRVDVASFSFKLRHYLNLYRSVYKTRKMIQALNGMPCVSGKGYLETLI